MIIFLVLSVLVISCLQKWLYEYFQAHQNRINDINTGN